MNNIPANRSNQGSQGNLNGRSRNFHPDSEIEEEPPKAHAPTTKSSLKTVKVRQQKGSFNNKGCKELPAAASDDEPEEVMESGDEQEDGEDEEGDDRNDYDDVRDKETAFEVGL